MSRSERRRLKRSGGQRVSGRQHSRAGVAAPWVAVGLLGLLAGGIWLGSGLTDSGHHPEPRPGINGVTVIPASRYVDYPRVNAVYSQARELAAVLDGLYCYCDCARHSGHRSLLTCFESDHAAACDVCLSEAAIAYRMTKDGQSLDDVRGAIDGMYGN